MRTVIGTILAVVALDAAGGDSLSGIGDVRLKGYLGERLEAMIARNVAGKDVEYITAPFREKTEDKGWWQTEFWGKWMHSAVPYLRYEGKDEVLREKIELGIDRILASQEPGGYIGNYPDELRCGENWDVWGMKYTMMGLLHYYDGERGMGNGERAGRALDACRRLCDYVIGEIGPGGKRGRELWQTGNWTGYASSSILEPVMWLYRRTNDRKYLDFAAYVVKGMSEPEAGPRLVDLALKGVSVADRNGHGNKPADGGGYVRKTSRIKAYEMMSCYQGLLEYCEVRGTGNGERGTGGPVPPDNLLKATLMAAEDIATEEINLAGGCACNERWFHGAKKQHIAYARLQETCVTITWMRLCEKLLDMTGDAKWADRLEQTFYNAYLAALKSDGSEFTSYTPLSGNRWHGMNHCFMHEDCCNSNGPRGFLCFLRKLFTTDGDTATFNFYASALVNGTVPKTGKALSFEMYSRYPRMDWARIVSHTQGAGVVPLRLRIPAWSAKTEVKLNGKVLEGVKAGGYFTVSREWKLGDVVEIKFDMPVVAHVRDHFAAFTRGPVLLARDSRFGDGDLCEAMHTDKRFGGGVADGEVRPTFAAVRVPSDGMWMAFSATLPIGAHYLNPEGSFPVTVFFCDYASAGNEWTRANSYRTWIPVESGPED